MSWKLKWIKIHNIHIALMYWFLNLTKNQDTSKAFNCRIIALLHCLLYAYTYQLLQHVYLLSQVSTTVVIPLNFQLFYDTRDSIVLGISNFKKPVFFLCIIPVIGRVIDRVIVYQSRYDIILFWNLHFMPCWSYFWVACRAAAKRFSALYWLFDTAHCT